MDQMLTFLQQIIKIVNHISLSALIQQYTLFC